MAEGHERILVLEDDRETAAELVASLSNSGYQVDLAVDGDEGLRRGRSGEYVVMTIDRILPGLDGLIVLQRLREDGIVTPALILSALGGIDDRVHGLRAGGAPPNLKPPSTPGSPSAAPSRSPSFGRLKPLPSWKRTPVPAKRWS